MSADEATLSEIVAHLKILRLSGLSEVRRTPHVAWEAEESAEPEVATAECSVVAVAERPATPPPRQREPSPSAGGEEPPGLRVIPPQAPVAAPADREGPWPAPMSREERVAALALAAEDVAGCVRCGELARTRKQTVFGVGNPMPRLVLLGEAPGAEEDERGEPFVGRAGQLLDRMIAACSLRREDVYILNVLKCRPPGNRNPLPAEATSCRPFLDRQFDILQPEFILCLGAVAAKNLLGVELSVGRMRGKLYRYRGATVVVTYHPSYLLRTEAAKRDAWEDLKFLLREMGIEPAKRRPEG
ncbi:MAG TPA: uracil-DNA glycosylase [Pirellulaceae bacterium]|jgi:DNA polymerase|nr:uracil-DNA glycosylase [Pirellulaceae bacterium]